MNQDNITHEWDIVKIQIENMLRNTMEMSIEEWQQFRSQRLINLNEEGYPVKYILAVSTKDKETRAAFYEINSSRELIYRVYFWRKPKRPGMESIPIRLGYKKRQILLDPEEAECDYTIENFEEPPFDEVLERILIHDFNITKTLENVWTDYFHEIWMCINKQEVPDMGLNNTLLVVTHPESDEWLKPGIIHNYKQIISNATGFSLGHILTVGEGKAMMQFACRKNLLTNIQKGVLLINMGENGIDFKYTSLIYPELREWSISIGREDIIQIILHDILKKAVSSKMEQHSDEQIVEESLSDSLKTMYGFEILYTDLFFDVNVMLEKFLDTEIDELTQCINLGENWKAEYSINDLQILLKKAMISASYNNFKRIAGKKNIVKPNIKLSMSYMEHLSVALQSIFEELKEPERGTGPLPLENIVVVGKNSHLPGVKESIEKTLEKIKKDNRFYENLTSIFKYYGCYSEEGTVFGAIYHTEQMLKNAQKILGDFPKIR